MSYKDKTLTTREYAEETGLSVSTITQMLRDGRLQGVKHRGKWAIHPDQQSQPTPQGKRTNKKDFTDKSTRESTQTVDISTAGRYDVPSFARLTYLTEKGVRQWLKSGRLTGSIDAKGNQFVDAANLDRPDFRHLVRK